MPRYYPIFINLQAQPVVVVGGGHVAGRKVETLLEYGASVRIVAPQLSPELQALVSEGRCRWEAREYQSGDLEDAVLVFSCTEHEAVNALVAKEARQAGRAVNVVDDPEKCSFIVPAILRRGELSIAVSTGGSSPLVAKQIRRELEGIYGEEMAAYLALLRDWRQEVKMHLPLKARAAFWARVTDGEVRQLILEKRMNEAKEVVEQCFRSLLA